MLGVPVVCGLAEELGGFAGNHITLLKARRYPLSGSYCGRGVMVQNNVFIALQEHLM